MRFVRLPMWGLSWPVDGAYYFARWVAHVGPWLVLIGNPVGIKPATHQDADEIPF